jgi:hypothetical protein
LSPRHRLIVIDDAALVAGPVGRAETGEPAKQLKEAAKSSSSYRRTRAMFSVATGSPLTGAP